MTLMKSRQLAEGTVLPDKSTNVARKWNGRTDPVQAPCRFHAEAPLGAAGKGGAW